MKIVEYGQEARERLKRGINELNRAVASTLGAAGRGVIIDDISGTPYITADGITVAEAFELEAPMEQVGVALVKSVCREANIVGDGTTTATVLATEMLNNGDKASLLSPVLVKKGMQKALDDVLKFLNKHKHKITSHSALTNIATISARGDKELGGLIAKAFKHIGKDGQIVVVEGRGEKSSVENINGYHIDKGFYSDAFVTNQSKYTTEFESPKIFVTDKAIRGSDEMMKLLEKLIKDNEGDVIRPMIIVASEIDEGALVILQSNVTKQVIKATFIEAPEFGDNQSRILEDLAFISGGKALLESSGISFSEIDSSYFGTVKKFISNRESSVFIDGEHTKDEIDTYSKNIETGNDKEFLKKRKSRLAGSLSKLTVGASSAIEMKEKRDRVEDAVNATKSALIEGYVVGGGIALFRAAQSLKIDGDCETEAEKEGYNLIIKSVESPMKQILVNLFGEDVEGLQTAISKISYGEHNYGLDVKTLIYGDLITMGIIDPIMVTKSSLEAAFSVASTIISTNCIIAITGENGDLKL